MFELEKYLNYNIRETHTMPKLSMKKIGSLAKKAKKHHSDAKKAYGKAKKAHDEIKKVHKAYKTASGRAK